MVSFKKLTNEQPCQPGENRISFKDKLPPGEAPPGVPPPGTEDICSCLGDKLDVIATEIQQTYDSGPSFNAHDINGNSRLFTEAATPIAIDASITSQSPDPTVIGWYNNIEVATTRGGVNLPLCWVIADPDGAVDPNNPFLYVRVSTDGTSTFSQEIAVRVGEDWAFRSVYSLRIRATVAGQQFRVTSDSHRTTFVSTIVNVPPGPGPANTTNPVANRPNFSTHSVMVPVADANLSILLGASISIPNGFALLLLANENNTGQVFISSTNATFIAQRTTLLAGSQRGLFITNTDLVHVASSDGLQFLDVVVEQ